MDGDPVAFGRDHDHDLEHVARTVGTEDEPPIWVLASVLDGERVGDGVVDVLVLDAMASSCWMDLNAISVIRKSTGRSTSPRVIEEVLGRRHGRPCDQLRHPTHEVSRARQIEVAGRVARRKTEVIGVGADTPAKQERPVPRIPRTADEGVVRTRLDE